MSHANGICKGCGAPIVWIKLNGRWHPANDRKLSIIADGKLVSGFESHYSSCPKADDFRSEPRA